MAATKQRAREQAPAQAHAAEPAANLPNDRATLLTLHQAARRRRDAAALMSHDRVAATFEIERIEIHIAAIERAMDPPLV